MFWCCCLLSLLLVLGDAYDFSNSRVRRQNVPLQNGQLIDNIFNIPITAIKQTATAAQAIAPENSQPVLDNLFKIPVSTLEAVGSLVKTTTEQRQQNAQNIQERRERLAAIKEQKRKRKEEIRNQRVQQQQVTRVVRHFNDPFGLNALTDLLVGHGGGHHGGHHINKLIGHHPLLCGNNCHGGIFGSNGHRPNGYEVHENVDEDTSFSWHGITAGFGTVHTRPFASAIKIENKVAPKQTKQKVPKYSTNNGNSQNKIANTRYKPTREYDDPPLENKIAPKQGRITFSQ
ncbi:uncharacterized protein LOC109854448 [Pseudomyrmex gracilis]|uniref:uncharacterized protein LOC109854448 n=1 Tax=Pseudomyrmex gracilis TaxID=219809 RepID=UPI0009958498|nr:uncharacterized protein LOC109854448 [Pseudomyrmex gracilis]